MSETDPNFRIIPPDPPRSPEVREFFAANPELDVASSLAFLNVNYPDKDSWIVDSGVAVQLLTGKRLDIPSDLDILCRNDAMEADFGHSSGTDPRDRRYIDVKSIGHWLEGRVGNVDEQAVWESIIATSSMHEINGATFRIMHPAIIVAGKSTLARMSPRPKDATDIAVLNVTAERLTAATELLRGNDPEVQVRLLTVH